MRSMNAVSPAPASTDPQDINTMAYENQNSKGFFGAVTPVDSKLLPYWDSLITTCITLTCIFGLFMATLDSSSDAMWAAVYMFDVVNLLDIIHRFFLSYKDKRGIPIVDRKQILNNYLRNGFILDAISVFPIEICATFSSFGGHPTRYVISWLRFNRLIRFKRVLQFFGDHENELGSKTALLRSMKYTTICLLATHSIACFWFAMACMGIHPPMEHIICRRNSWADNEHFSIGFNMTHVSSGEAYLVSLYWAVATATSTGYGDISAVNIGEMWYSIGAMMFGISVFFGMLLGGMASMLTNFDQQRADYVHRFENIKEHMIEEKVPDDLQKQVIGYYEYFWARKKGVEMDGVYNNLPLTFQAEICHSTNKEVLEKAPIFHGIGTGFLRMLSLMIQYRLCLPKQLIVKRGEIGHEMFFIQKGEVDVLSDQDDNTPVATLTVGRIFGEVSLLYSVPRTATIRAKTHCDLLVLHREHMQSILTHYPEVMQRLQETAKKRFQGAAEPPKVIQAMSKLKAKPSELNPSPVASHSEGSRSFMECSNTDSLGLHVHEQRKTVSFSENMELVVDDDEEAAPVTKDPPQVISRKLNGLLRHSTIDPNGKIARCWEYTIIMVVMFIAVCYPYMACYTAPIYRSGYFDSALGKVYLLITYLCDLVLLLDIFMNLRMEVITEHGTLEDIKDIAQNYLKSSRFYVDVLAVLPLELFCFLAPHHSVTAMFAFLRLGRLIKFIEIPKLFVTLEENLNSNIEKVRCWKFVFYIFLLSHWVSCALYAMACYGLGCVDESWFGLWKADTFNGTDPSPAMDYIVSLYMASATMTSTGYGDLSGHTVSGRLISLIAMLIGLLLYGYALSAMAATLATGDTSRVEYQGRLLAIRAFMKERHLNEDIKKRVVDYLCLLWDKHKGIWVPGMPPLMHDVPIALQEDIAVEEAVHTLGACPLFKDVSDGFLRSLAVKTESFLFRPGEVLVYAGDISFEMYCIRNGYCEIHTPGMKEMLCQIGPGQYFGELGMLFEEYRDTSVVARTSVEVVEIKYSDLKEVLQKFPLAKAQFDEVFANKEKYEQQQEILHEYHPSLKKMSSSQVRIDGNSSHHLKVVGETFVRDPFKAKGLVSFYNCEPEIKEELEQGYREMPMYGRILAKILMKAALNPMNKDLKFCALFILLISIAQAFWIPLHAAFYPRDTDMLLVLYVLDFSHFCNIYLRSHLAYFNDEDVVFVTHPIFAAHYYMYTNFIVDMMGTVPYELLILCAGVHTFIDLLPFVCLLRMTRLLHMYRVPLAASHLEGSVARTTGSIRAAKFFLYTAVFLNFVTCVSYFIAAPAYVGSELPEYFDPETRLIQGSWLYNTLSANNVNLTEATQSVTTMYVLSLYWAAATTVSVGYGDISANLPHEMVTSLIIMIMGVLFFGYIIASVAAGMANADTQRAIYADKLRAIKAYMEDQNVPESLKDRVLAHYNHLYIRTKGIDPKSLFNALPQSLWGDLALGLYETIIGEIELFQDTDVSFLKMLCKTIEPKVFLKGEYIVRQGDIGTEMFFIHRGIIDVVASDESVVFDTMDVGEAFGEVALLFDCPRTASVKARTNCDLFVLSKADLDTALNCYPDVKEKMLVVAQERLNKARQRSLTNVRKSMSKLTPQERDNIQGKIVYPPRQESNMEENFNLNNLEAESDVEDDVSLGQMQMEVITPKTSIVSDMIAKTNNTIDPSNRYLRYYTNWMCIVGILSSFLVVLQAAFQEHHIAVIVLNYFCDIFFVFHILIKFRCAYYTDEGDLISDSQMVKKKYMKTKSGFPRDFLSTIPLEIVALAFPYEQQWYFVSMLRIPRTLRIFGVIDYFHVWEKEVDINMLAMRLCQNVVMLGIYMHIISSMWYVLACPPWGHGHCHSGSWFEFTRNTLVSTMDKYCTCMYWCTATITSTGYGDEHAYTEMEMVFSAGVMIFGKLVLGFILGNIASTLQNADANRVHYDERLTGIKNNMEDQNVPKLLRNRVASYFSHIWLRTQGVDIQEMFEDCPKCLLAELSLTITRQMLEKIPLFETTDESFFRQICLKIKQILFLPNDYIIKKGDVSTGLLYIHRGEVEIISEDESAVVMHTMKEGEILGEASLIADTPRRVTARAKTHVDLFCLSKEDLDDILNHYPDTRKKIDDMAKIIFPDMIK